MRIRKNATKKIAKMVTKIENAKSYTLDNCFRGVEIDSSRDFAGIIREELDCYRGGPLTVDEERKMATLHIHSNHWITFKPADVNF